MIRQLSNYKLLIDSRHASYIPGLRPIVLICLHMNLAFSVGPVVQDRRFSVISEKAGKNPAPVHQLWANWAFRDSCSFKLIPKGPSAQVAPGAPWAV